MEGNRQALSGFTDEEVDTLLKRLNQNLDANAGDPTAG